MAVMAWSGASTIRRRRVARLATPAMQQIQARGIDPVMASAASANRPEARILEALEVDFIDASEVLTPADEEFHIDKREFSAPFVCGCRDLAKRCAALRGRVTAAHQGRGRVPATWPKPCATLRRLRAQIRR